MKEQQIYHCPYCGTKRRTKTLCPNCSDKLKLIRKLLGMVKTNARDCGYFDRKRGAKK